MTGETRPRGRSLHPLSLAARLALELAALASFGFWGWQAADGGPRFLLAVAAPLAAAVLWSVFAVPGDPSRSGRAPVPTPGPVRLVLELAVLFGGAAALYASGAHVPAIVFAAVLVVYHLVAGDRIGWLLRAGRVTAGAAEALPAPHQPAHRSAESRGDRTRGPTAGRS